MTKQLSLDLSGKVALITGASRGIGRETALQMAMAGARVVVNYHSSAREAEEVVAEIGANAIAVRADVAKPGDVERLMSETLAKFGRIDIAVNNAATYAENRFDSDDFDGWQRGWRRTFELNVFGAANVAFLAMRSMRHTGGGRIINVSSRAAFRGETEFADYGASKAALVNLTRSIARACAKDNIIASCVTPGFIETDMAREAIERDRAAIEAQIPLGRVGTVEDVAGVILSSPRPWPTI